MTILATVGPAAIDRMAADLLMCDQNLTAAKAELAAHAQNKTSRFADASSDYTHAYRMRDELATRITRIAENFGTWSSKHECFLLLGKGYAIQLKDEDRITVILCAGAEN